MKTKIINTAISDVLIDLKEIKTDHLVIISDSNVWSLYNNHFEGLYSTKWISPPGEDGKTYQNFENCCDHLLEQGIHRNAHILAFGGGAVSDFAGFVASTILRGVPWSILPTTLLGMVDASIGGKVGINSQHGKNLVGQFYMPQKIWLDIDFLKTLSEEEFQSGKGELLKYGFLNKKIFDRILLQKEIEKDLILSCAEFKSDLVEKDFREEGPRKVLNLGHTFGHAFEKVCQLPHGVAITYGIQYIIENHTEQRFKERLSDGLMKLSTHLGLKSLLEKKLAISDEEIRNFVSRDKKKISKNMIELILLQDVGTSFVNTIAVDEIV